jgi:IS30 family transposase
VSREVAANGWVRRYRAVVADRAALRRARRPKPAKLAMRPELCALVESKLRVRWSPQQISGWLSETYPDRPEMWVPHETIYLSLFVQSRGALRKELTRFLRSGQATRRTRGRRAYDGGRGKLRGMVLISERPAEVEDRAVPGHWEGDLVFGTAHSAMATLVERHSRYVMLVGLPNGHTADVVADALSAKIAELPERLRGSLAWDQGSEMARHARFTVDTGVPVYFCDPHSPWQRGSNETPTDCSASTSRNANHSHSTRPNSTPSPTSSTDVLDKPSDGGHHHKHSTRRCDDRLRPRPLWDRGIGGIHRRLRSTGLARQGCLAVSPRC